MNRKLTSKGKDKIGLTRIEVTLKSPEVRRKFFGRISLWTRELLTRWHRRVAWSQLAFALSGARAYELADGTKQNYQFGLAEISFMNEVTAGRVIFGPEGVEPILGVTALESAGITVDPANQTLRRLPAIPLK
jgi:hypothetical protein